MPVHAATMVAALFITGRRENQTGAFYTRRHSETGGYISSQVPNCATRQGLLRK